MVSTERCAEYLLENGDHVAFAEGELLGLIRLEVELGDHTRPPVLLPVRVPMRSSSVHVRLDRVHTLRISISVTASKCIIQMIQYGKLSYGKDEHKQSQSRVRTGSYRPCPSTGCCGCATPSPAHSGSESKSN